MPDVVQGDVEAALRERHRDTPPDAAVARRAGDECNRRLDHHPDLAGLGDPHLVGAQADVGQGYALPVGT